MLALKEGSLSTQEFKASLVRCFVKVGLTKDTAQSGTKFYIKYKSEKCGKIAYNESNKLNSLYLSSDDCIAGMLLDVCSRSEIF